MRCTLYMEFVFCSDLPQSGGGVLPDALPTPGRAARSELQGKGGGRDGWGVFSLANESEGVGNLTCVFPFWLCADDYYDTEDPSVNLHEFIVNSLQAQK